MDYLSCDYLYTYYIVVLTIVFVFRFFAFLSDVSLSHITVVLPFPYSASCHYTLTPANGLMPITARLSISALPSLPPILLFHSELRSLPAIAIHLKADHLSSQPAIHGLCVSPMPNRFL